MTETASKPPKTPLWRRMLISAGRTTLTLIVIGAAGAIGVTAHGALSARASQVEGPAPAPSTTIAPMILEMRDTLTVTRSFAGQFEPPQETALGFEDGGTIAEVLVREGDTVADGDLIATLDTRLLDAERTRLLASRMTLEAQAELARRTNDRQLALLEAGHVTAQRVDETSLQLAQIEASITEIDAAVATLDVRLSKTEIRAPFSGRIGTRRLDVGAVAAPGAPVVTLLEDGPARFRVGLDPALAAALAPDTSVEITSGSVTYSAQLADLSPELDAVTRARIAFFDLEPGAHPPSRATGEVTMQQDITSTGAWVPLSALRQGPRGTWLLLTVDTSDTPVIATEAAEILHLDAGRAFIRGSFTDGTLVVLAGTHRVVPGEPVFLAPEAS